MTTAQMIVYVMGTLMAAVMVAVGITMVVDGLKH